MSELDEMAEAESDEDCAGDEAEAKPESGSCGMAATAAAAAPACDDDAGDDDAGDDDADDDDDVDDDDDDDDDGARSREPESGPGSDGGWVGGGSGKKTLNHESPFATPVSSIEAPMEALHRPSSHLPRETLPRDERTPK